MAILYRCTNRDILHAEISLYRVRIPKISNQIYVRYGSGKRMGPCWAPSDFDGCVKGRICRRGCEDNQIIPKTQRKVFYAVAIARGFKAWGYGGQTRLLQL